MIVPGIGLLILVLFIGAEFLTSNPVQQTKTSTRAFSVPGTPLRAMPAVHDLKVITVSGQPPGNIINAVSIPDGATRTSYQNNSNGGPGVRRPDHPAGRRVRRPRWTTSTRWT